MTQGSLASRWKIKKTTLMEVRMPQMMEMGDEVYPILHAERALERESENQVQSY